MLSNRASSLLYDALYHRIQNRCQRTTEAVNFVDYFLFSPSLSLESKFFSPIFVEIHYLNLELRSRNCTSSKITVSTNNSATTFSKTILRVPLYNIVVLIASSLRKVTRMGTVVSLTKGRKTDARLREVEHRL